MSNEALYPCEEIEFSSPEIDLALADSQIKSLSRKLKECEKENGELKKKLEDLKVKAGESLAD